MLKWLILAGYVLTAIVYIALEYFSISSYEMIALFFLGAYMVEITRIIPRINGQKLLYLEKSNILSSLYIIGSIMIVLLYSQLMTFFGLGIIFLSETLVYFLITYYMHKYILENTGFTIVRINILFWFFVFGTSIYLLLYFLSSYTPKAIV